MQNLVSLTHPNLQILGKTQTQDRGISDVRISGQSLMKENYENSKISYDIAMKLAPVTELYKSDKTTTKKNLTMTSRK